MSYFCQSCRKELTLSDRRVGRRDACPHCKTDLHSCKNCCHHDPKAYNECRESQADRVVDKGVSNFCDYFSFHEGALGAAQNQEKATALKKLDDLFKK